MGWILTFVLIEVAGRLFGGDPLGRVSAARQLTSVSSGRLLLVLGLVVAAYEVVPVALRGATLGKAALGLRIVRLDTWERPGLVNATLRAVVLYGPLAVPALGLIVLVLVITPAVVWPTRRGVHDLVAGTAVVAVDRPHPPERP